MTYKTVIAQEFIDCKDIKGDSAADYVLDYGSFQCGDNGIFFCGSANCTMQVFASVKSGYVKILDENVQALTFGTMRGCPAMVLGLHGSACGRVES